MTSPDTPQPQVVSAAALRAALAAVLDTRTAGASCCPSEIARHLDPAQWRALMPAVRRAAADLAARGELRITQRDVTVAPQQVRDGSVRGPLRLRRP